MSFIASETGRGFEAGYFLVDNEACTRLTRTIPADHAQVVTLGDGRKIVPAGAVFPANDGTAVGILYEDIDVSDGAAPGSVVTAGEVYTDRLPAAPESAAVTAMTGIRFIANSPSVVRPNFDVKGLAALTVQSAAGTAAGDTKITVSGYTRASSDGYKYSVGDTAATVHAGDDLSAWTTWDGSADITAATDKKITVAVVDANGFALAAGSATVVAKT